MNNLHKTISLFLLMSLWACNSSRSKEEGNQSVSDIVAQKASVFVTASNTDLRLSKTEILKFDEYVQPKETQPFIYIDPQKTFQTVLGIGAALTDAAAETFYKLDEDTQKKFLTAYYDETKGIGYNFSRTNIASCDFSSDTYAYVEENDTALTSFSVAHDLVFKIPFIKKVIEAVGGELTLFASPWSPPAWMKDNNDALHGGKLRKEYMKSWAKHYVKFIEAYEAEGIPVWGISVQNEPMAVQTWESCVFSAEEERDFIKNYLGPTLHNNGMADKKLIAWDHNRDQAFQRANTILSDPEAAKYVWGIGFHWYESWTGGEMQFFNIQLVNQTYPEKPLILTEACNGKFNLDQVGEWRLGERYGHSMVNDFNSGAVAWTDWNILLDETGGPNHVGNFCFAPIIADTRTGELIYTNSYYYIGHFSKFVKKGAKRIAASSSRTALETTAFLNPDGSIAVVVLNRSENNISYQLILGEKAVNLESLPHSISTVII